MKTTYTLLQKRSHLPVAVPSRTLVSGESRGSNVEHPGNGTESIPVLYAMTCSLRQTRSADGSDTNVEENVTAVRRSDSPCDSSK